MAYATQEDIKDRYGEDLLYRIADRDNDSIIDTKAVTRALSDAGNDIDSYVGVVAELPLKTVPPVLTRVCVDIAVYYLAGDRVTEEQSKRHDDAIAMLKRISEGKAKLDLPTEKQPEDMQGSAVSARQKIFDADTLDRY